MSDQFDESNLKEISDIVYQTSGIVFKDSNMAVLISRLATKLKEKHLDIRQYVQLLRADQLELMSFIDFVTTNFTSFFRSQRHFDMLEETILPELIEKNKSSKTIKIWSAGCSTGEETYTIALVVSEFLSKNHGLSDWKVQIIGSDISLDSLFIAKEGKYPERSVCKIEPKYLDKYFIPLEEKKYYLMKDEVRKMVKFDYHNLIYDSIFTGIDVTFCRNVLIYFDSDIQKKVLSKIYDAMNMNGFLFVGHSESLIGLYDGFKPKSLAKGIVYVKQSN